MDKTWKKLWIRALEGDAGSYRKIGILLWQNRQCREDVKLARLCFWKAAELGDEKGFLLYHRIFSKGKKVIDDLSYEKIKQDYKAADHPEEKKRLARYLKLGTRKQRLTNLRC